MQNMIGSMNTFFIENKETLGLTENQIYFTDTDHDKVKYPSISIYPLQTNGEDKEISGGKEKYNTIIQIDIYAKDDTEKNLTAEIVAMNIRDKIEKLLKNRTIERIDRLTEPPIKKGYISFSYQDEESFSMGENNNIRIISMTYNLSWWKPKETD
ncbi:hypothetical protein [Vallitalea guaymasensis]|uniref:hypothetical protein n=1 Tax=Vallitalea guaymasensis TaxID=1185412 RepID=UPI000DE569CB|nr:hypothetical protein [Vallitalea guaymasensis]